MRKLPSTAGRLIVYKEQNGNVEKLHEFNNILTFGFSVNMANFFTSDGRSQIENIIPQYCQLGTGVVNYLADTTEGNNQFYNLEIPLTRTQYGRNLRRKVLSKSQITNVTNFDSLDRSTYTESTGLFLQIPKSAITIKRNSGANIRIVLDKYTANGNTLREIGLFTGGLSLDGSNKLLLSCYKQFSPIAKTNEFSLIFDWTIQATDLNSVLVWQTEEEYSSTIGDTNTGDGGGPPRGPAPSFAYKYTGVGGDNWDVRYPLTNFPPIIPLQNPSNSFIAGSFGFRADSIAEATASGFSISAVNGAVSAVGTAPPQDGTGILYVSATPKNTNYGPYTASLGYEITRGKTVDDPGSTYLGQITWKVPEGAIPDTSTVIRCVVPVSAGDFESAVWGNYTNWLISGVDNSVISPFASSGVVAQIEPVQKNPSGGYESVEVIFPTVIKYDPSRYQYYDVYSTSVAPTGTPPTLDSSAFINIKTKDLSGNIYSIANPQLFTSGNLATSSILKSGPYLTTYKFVYRQKPEATASFPNATNIEHRPYGLTIFAYVTVKKYDPVYKIDLRIANGLYMMPNGGWGGGPNDAVGGVYKTSQEFQPRNILGNFYYANMWMEHNSDLSAVHNILSYNISHDPDWADTYGVDRVNLVSPYAALGETKYGWNDSLRFEENIKFKCHVFPKQKHFSRKFALARKDSGLNHEYLKAMANYGDIAFPSRGRSWYSIPKWGPVGDLAPNLGTIGTFQNRIYEYKEAWNLTRRPASETWTLPGSNYKECFAFLSKRKFSDLERASYLENWNNTQTPDHPSNNVGVLGGEEICFNGAYGTATEGQGQQVLSNKCITNAPAVASNNNNYIDRSKMPYRTKLPFNTFGFSDPDQGSPTYINLYPGITLTNEELDYLGLRCQHTSQRTPWVYNVSGVPVSIGDVMNYYGFTPFSAGNIDVFDTFYLTYYGQIFNKNSPNEFIVLPYTIFAWKSNSNAAEPTENVIRLDNINSPTYTSNILSSVPNSIAKQLINSCPYAYKVMTFSPDRVTQESWNAGEIGSGDKIFGKEHISRFYPVLMTQCQLTNDPLLKDEFEMFATLCAHTYPPYPTSVRLMGLTANNLPTLLNRNRFTAYKYLANVSSTTTSGQGFVFENSRGTVHPVAAMAGYYSFAPSSWKSKNEYSLDFMASGFHYAWIRENGHIGCDYIDNNGSPAFGGIFKGLYYGHHLSSTPTDPTKVAYKNYPLAFSQPYANNTTIVPNGAIGQLTVNGNYFAASTLGDQAFMLSYQSYAFAMLAKHALRYRKPDLYNSLTSAVAIQASSMVFNVFSFVSGNAGVSDIAAYVRDSQDTAFFDAINTNTSEIYKDIVRRYTYNEKVFDGVAPNGINLAAANTTDILTTIRTMDDVTLSSYLSPVSPTKVFGGFPNIVGTCTDSLTANYFSVDGGNAGYRGYKKNGTVSIPKQGFTSSDYATKNLRGDRVRQEDCFTFFSNGMMADKNWELSALDASNTFVGKCGMMGNTYFDSYLKSDSIYNLSSQSDKADLLNAAATHYQLLITSKQSLYLVGPILAYLKYLRPSDNNGT
jgi:hypothetical protein